MPHALEGLVPKKCQSASQKPHYVTGNDVIFSEGSQFENKWQMNSKQPLDANVSSLLLW